MIFFIYLSLFCAMASFGGLEASQNQFYPVKCNGLYSNPIALILI